MDVIQDPNGNWINRNFRTSPVEEIRELSEGGLEIITRRSVYRFEQATLKPPVFLDEALLVEIYMTVDNYQFCNGYFYDSEKQPHQLTYDIYGGMFQDSVLIRRADTLMGNYVCRYFPRGTLVTFYDTLYREHDYSYRMLIHNTGGLPLKIEFEYYNGTWTIYPGETKMITPGCNAGADSGSFIPVERLYEEMGINQEKLDSISAVDIE